MQVLFACESKDEGVALGECEELYDNYVRLVRDANK